MDKKFIHLAKINKLINTALHYGVFTRIIK